MTEHEPLALVHSSPFCGYCAASKRLLKEKGANSPEIDVLFDPEQRRQMERRAPDAPCGALSLAAGMSSGTSSCERSTRTGSSTRCSEGNTSQ
jgi:hypothetical protein